MKFSFTIFTLFIHLVLFGQINSSGNPEILVAQLLELSEEARETNRTKSLSYLQEALNYETKVSDKTLLNLYKMAGLTYKDWESYYIALNYFFKELELQNRIDPQKSFLILNNIGGCYYQMGDFKKTREFLELAVKDYQSYSKNNNERTIESYNIYNNLALLEIEEKNYARALEMLKEFKRENEILNDTLNLTLAYENLAEVYLKLNEEKTAKEHLWKGIALAGEIDAAYDLSQLYTNLGSVYLKSSDMDSAFIYLKKSYDLSDQHSFADIKLTSSQELVTYYKNKNDTETALYYLETAKSLSEEIINEENSRRVSGLELEFNEKMKQIDIIESQKKREIFFIGGIVILLLFSTIAFLMFKLQKSKSQKKAAEIQLLAQKLEEKNKELTSNALQMMQTNELIETTHKELKDLKNPNNRMLTRVISDLRKGSQVFSKNEFDKLYMEVDSDFYKRLVQKYPTLSKNDLRMCAFLRLNLSSKEISDITQKSPQTIAVARHRLRKKIGMEEGESLTNFLIQF